MKINKEVKFIPGNDRIIIRVLEIKQRETRKGSTLLVPDHLVKRKEVEGDMYDMYPCQAIIVAVGKTKDKDGKLIDMSYNEGDIVYLETFPPVKTEMQLTSLSDTAPYHFIRESHIIGINNNEEEIKKICEWNKERLQKEFDITI